MFVVFKYIGFTKRLPNYPYLALFLLIISKIISKLHIFHFCVFFIFFYKISHGNSFEDHGAFNLIAFFLVFFLIIINGLIIKAFFSLFIIVKRKHKIKKFSILTILILFYSNLFNPMECSDWGKGLNNTFIENDIKKYKCNIIFPKRCPYHIFKYFLDFTKLSSLDCSKSKIDNKKLILRKSKSKYINKNTKKFGFPLTNKDLIGRLDGKDDHLLKSFVLNNLFDIDIQKRRKNKTELILDFSKRTLGKYIIDVKFNKSLSKERKKLEKNVSPYSNNIMIVYIDSVSRANSIRQLKKTLNFFERFMPYKGGYNSKYPNEKYHSFQFFKYHSFKNYTAGNYPRLFYGNSKFAKNRISLSKYFKENGFITNYNSDYCRKDNSRTGHNFTFEEVYDHQFLLCDPNVFSFNSFYKKCLYGKSNVEYVCDYAEQFWRKYEKNRKYSVIILNDGHEGTLEALKYTDEYIHNYLFSLFKDGLLKDTSVFLLSDHGVGMPFIYSLYEFYRKEIGLPMLYLLINDRRNISWNEQYFHLNENQQTFITAYDIYNTIIHLLYGNLYLNNNKSKYLDIPKSEFGRSLFTHITKVQRKSINYNQIQYILCK